MLILRTTSKRIDSLIFVFLYHLMVAFFYLCFPYSHLLRFVIYRNHMMISDSPWELLIGLVDGTPFTLRFNHFMMNTKI